MIKKLSYFNISIQQKSMKSQKYHKKLKNKTKNKNNEITTKATT